jgi:hypothetical protein
MEELTVYDLDPSPVRILVDGGWWRLYRLATPHGDSPRFGADLLLGRPATGAVSFHIDAVSVWGLEEQVGFALPQAVHDPLHRAAPSPPAAATAPSAGTPSPPGTLPVTDPDLRPGRGHRIDIAGHGTTTYGRLLHGGTLRTWTDGTHRVDIVTASPTRAPAGDTSLTVAYRIWHGDMVVFAGDDIRAAITFDPRTDDALRLVVGHVLHADRDRRVLTDRQQTFLDTDGKALAGALAEPAPPYPPGSRVTVNDLHGRTATGVVLDLAGDGDEASLYLWRPDLADLPGHPWHGTPRQTLTIPADRVHFTLAPPDRGVDGHTTPPVLTFGATVASLDDWYFDTGTVLRAFHDGGDEPVYEVQPDEPGLAPTMLPASSVIPTAATGWPDVATLLEARKAADLPLRIGEILVTVRETTQVRPGPSGALRILPARPRPPADPLFDPDRRPAPNAGPVTPGLLTNDNITHLRDPHHGHIDVATRLFTAALTHPADTLHRLIEQHSTAHLTGDEPLTTLAALAAAHTPDKIATTPASTPQPPDAETAGTPAPASTDIHTPGPPDAAACAHAADLDL